MRRTSLAVAALLWSLALRAAQDPGPLLVKLSDDVGSSVPKGESWQPGAAVYGLIGDWASNSINKKSRAFVAAFRAAPHGLDLSSDPARLLACTAVPEPHDKCRDAADAGHGITDTLAAHPAHRGTFVLLTPEWSGEQLMIRAMATEIEYADGHLVPRRNYTALFTTRAPQDVIRNAKKQKGALEAWWLEGSPNRLETETRRGFAELSGMLTLLAAEVGTASQFPEKWLALPDVKELERAKRVYCGGMGCAKAHRIVREADGRTWLTFVNGTMPLSLPADKGTVLASFDAAALEHALNLYMYTQMGVSSY
jgi:hypothetical protein